MSRQLDQLVVRETLADVAGRMLEERSTNVVDRMARFRDDPVGFARRIMGVEPWARQIEILEAVASIDRVLVRSGHKVGKSLTAIILALWFVATRPRGRVLMTAPTAEQIKRVLWREMGLHYPRVSALLEGPPELPLDPATGVAFSGMREIFGRAAKTKEGAAGVSGGEMLFLVDEASGVSDEMYEALKGNAAGGVKFAAFSNPTKPSGWYFEGFRNGIWRTIHISSEESPNVVRELERRARRASVPRPPQGEQQPPVPVAGAPGELRDPEDTPGLAGLAWIEEMRQECGANYTKHPIYQVRVVGEFPSTGPNAICGLESVEAARRRWDAFVKANLEAGREIDHGIWAPLELGVDPARYGDDDAVVHARRGLFHFAPEVLSGRVDEKDLAALVVQTVRRLRRPEMDRAPVRVKIDEIGVGVYVIGALREHEAYKKGEIELCCVNVSEAADDPEKYSNLRSQLWFAGGDVLAEGLEADEAELPGVMLPPVPRLTQELLVATFKFDARRRQQVASKDELRALLKRSPNHADAFNLAVYNAPHGHVKVLTGSDLEKKRKHEPQRSVY